MPKTQQLWDSLQRVRSVRYVCQSSTPGWDGTGIGAVGVESQSESVIVYTESGTWHPSNGRETRFNNVFRWTLIAPELIRLEHLRFGAEQPVFLFDVAPSVSEGWSSVQPHLCDRDCYAAEMQLQDSGIKMCWAVTGPRKQERIEYTYGW